MKIISDYFVENLGKNIDFAEYIAEYLGKNIDFAEYIAENLGKNIDIAEYIAENLGNYGKSEKQVLKETRLAKLKKLNKNND